MIRLRLDVVGAVVASGHGLSIAYNSVAVALRSAADAAAWAGNMAASHKWNKCSCRAHSRRRSTHYHGRTCQYRLHLSEFLGPRPWQQPLAAMVMMSHDHGHDHGHDHSHDHMIHITPPHMRIRVEQCFASEHKQ